jgi:hypothetical protein
VSGAGAQMHIYTLHTHTHTRTLTHTYTHTQAQSLDVRQAIDAALEAAGPRYREHYSEWGAVHTHSSVAQGEDGSAAAAAAAAVVLCFAVYLLEKSSVVRLSALCFGVIPNNTHSTRH